ncbi:MAG: DUF3592 domain-containing protein [Chloroflexi bacterium]|nr:DUF3592 domain-containing protein [Chloroflexota bacterium]
MGRFHAPQQTGKSVRSFDTWFGAIFLGVGLAALAFGLILFRVLDVYGDVGAGAWLPLVLGGGIGVIFLIIGGFFFRHGLEKSQREQRLRMSGTMVDATVVAVEPTGATINERRLWHVRYVYVAHTGQEYEGESGYLEPGEAQSYGVGERAAVLYDPADPPQSAWVGRDQPR